MAAKYLHNKERVLNNFWKRIAHYYNNDIYIYEVKKTDNVPSRLLTICLWSHGHSCTWPHDVQLHIDGSNEPKSAQQVKQGAQCIMKLARCDSLRLSHFCEI